MTDARQAIIESAWDNRQTLSPTAAPADIRDAVQSVLADLDAGALRVATLTDRAAEGAARWTVHQWLKKAVLLSFRLTDNAPMQAGMLQFFDKVPTKFDGMSAEAFARAGYRVVPPAVARRGSFIGKNVVLMPSYVNIGAYVDEGTMVDTWATVGSAHRSARTSTCRAGSALAACWSRCRPTPPSSRTTASSARAPRWSRV